MLNKNANYIPTTSKTARFEFTIDCPQKFFPCDKISTFFEVLAGIKLVDFAFGLKLLELFSQTRSKPIYFGSFAHLCSPSAKWLFHSLNVSEFKSSPAGS